MIKYENDCVGCPTYCIHCGRKHAPHFYCDECEEEDELYEFEDRQLCADCVLASLSKVEGSEEI